jgi:CRISPR type II-A-associated protein Csn2
MRLINTELFLDLKNIEINPYILVIESSSLMFNTIRGLNNQIDGYDGDFVLSDCQEPIEIKKNLQLIVDPFSIRVNDSKVIKKVQELITEEALNEVHYEETNKIMIDLEKYAESLAFTFDGNVVAKDSLSAAALIKLLGFEIDYFFESFEEMILEYIITVNKYLNIKVFCFVNLFSFLEYDQIKNLIHDINNNHINVIFLESTDPQSKFEDCRKIIIDSDFCQI